MKSIFRHLFYLLVGFSILMLFTHCGNSSKDKIYKIGFSQCTMDDVWRVQMLKEMEREAFLIQDMNLKIELRDAQNSLSKQKEDIRELVKQGVDVLIVSPLRSEPLKALIDSVAKLDIPIILVDRHINSEENIFYIGANNFKIGEEAGKETIRLLPNGGTVLTFTGLSGSKPAAQRENGFLSVVEKNKQYKIKPIECDWTEETAFLKMKEVLDTITTFDLIFAHNDFMAKGAIRALSEMNRRIPPTIGVDGLSAPGYGIDMVLDSLLTATLTYPTGGDVSIRTAYYILSHQEIPFEQELNSVFIDQSNVKAIKIQRDEIDRQVETIDQQNQLIANKENEISQQRSKLIRISAILFTIIAILLVAVYFLRKRKTMEVEEEKEFQYSFPIPLMNGLKDDEIQFIEEIEKVVLNNLINHKLTIQFVADKFGMSHSTIYRRIKNITGLKGVELINLIRLQYAEKLLVTTNLSIKEIAFQTGFSTSSYFSTSFVKQYGISPVKLRSQRV